MSHAPTITEEAIKTLRLQVQGAVFVPGDEGYGDAGRAWNLSVQQHPAVIVAASTASDVAAAVGFAREQGLGVAVQSTGHGVIRPADNCLQIVTSQMADVTVDAEAQTAWIEAGAPWGAVIAELQKGPGPAAV